MFFHDILLLGWNKGSGMSLYLELFPVSFLIILFISMLNELICMKHAQDEYCVVY